MKERKQAGSPTTFPVDGAACFVLSVQGRGDDVRDDKMTKLAASSMSRHPPSYNSTDLPSGSRTTARLPHAVGFGLLTIVAPSASSERIIAERSVTENPRRRDLSTVSPSLESG